MSYTIGIDIRSLMEGKRSGVEEYLINLLHHLFRIDTKNNYILFSNSFRDVSHLIPEFSYPNVRYSSFRFPNKLFNLSLKLFHAPRLDRLIGGCDLFFVPNPRITPLSKSVIKILTVHDCSFDSFPSFYSIKRQLWHKVINPAYEMRSAAKIIAVSHSTKQSIVTQYHIDPHKISVIHSGLLQENNFSSMREVRLKYNLPKTYFLFLGTLEPRKNIEGLIRAFHVFRKEEHAKISLVIAGQKGWLYQPIFQLIQTLQLEKAVHILGFVHQKDKPALFQLSQTFIYPSFYEGFGFPPLEALTYDKPVITSVVSSLPEIVKQHAFLVNPWNISEIKQAMKLCYTSSIPSNPSSYAQSFRWDKTAQHVLSLFESTGDISV